MQRVEWKKHLPALALTLAAMIWGAGFISVQIALDSGFSEGMILFGRFFVAALALLAAAGRQMFPLSRRDLRCGLIAGFLLFLGFYVQTAGLRFTTPSNNGFFTATNVIMVPLIAWALQKKRPPAKLFFCSFMALIGFFVLAWNPGQGFSVNTGDLLTLLCAFFFACHIASLGVFSPLVEPMRLTFLQIVFAGGFSLAAFLLFDLPALPAVNWKSGLPAVIFMGLFPTCLCFLIQTWAQRKVSSGKAAVLLSCESLWCMIFSVLLGYEVFSLSMAAGGLIIVGAVSLLEWEPPSKYRSGERALGNETWVA